MLNTAERRTSISRSPPSTPRLQRQPPRPPRGPSTLLDGGWWPRSADPVAELPGLILALDDKHSPITRVMLRRADWDSHPHRLRIDDPAIDSADSGKANGGAAAGRVVRLGWFDTMPAGLLTALRADGGRIDLLTVPEYTNHTAAWTAMELAADPGNHLHTPDLRSALTFSTTQAEHPEHPEQPEHPEHPEHPEQPVAGTAPEDTWESEGGQVNDHAIG
jgi:hypothetical protein